MSWFEKFLFDNIGEELKRFGFRKMVELSEQLFQVVLYRSGDVYLYFEFEDHPNVLSVGLGNLYRYDELYSPRVIGLYHLHLQKIKTNCVFGEGLEKSIECFKQTFSRVMENLPKVINDVETEAKALLNYPDCEIANGQSVVSKGKTLRFQNSKD